ncbi:MAG: TRAP transporter large permease subunit [Hungatella sp.]|nr:TRAP transporter large permease subunit [Hungatella sp.]
MGSTMLWAFITLVIFIVILALPKIPNWMTFLCMAPVVVFSGVMSSSDVYGVLNSSGLHLMIIICMFSGMIAATGLDVVIGDAIDKMTGSVKGEKKEMMILAIIYVVSGLVSFVLQNSYVAMAFLPVLFSISKRNNISHSKLILFVIYSTTLGGACTLIGTPTNVYANTALEEAGLELFGMLDFAWVGLPIFLIGGLYMVIMNRWCPSYEETVPTGTGTEMRELTAEQKNKQKIVGLCFAGFVIAMIAESFFKIKCNPNFIGYGLIAVSVLTTIVTPKEVMSSLNAELILFCAGINLLIAVMKISGLGDVFGGAVLSILGDNRNLYFITAVLFIGSAIMTSFMNNMATAGVLAPIGISIANALGANPQAIVLAIAIGSGCSYLTPIASGTNQNMVIFSNLKFTDFAKFGWPLVIISLVCCVGILPLVFPFF